MVGVERRDVGPEPTERVRRPIMWQSWNHITFLHWRYDPEEVQRLLPDRLEVETFDGSAWVGLTPFLLEKLRFPEIPPLPWLSKTPETNVRTYVRGPDGRSGISFFSLDIARAPAVAVARTAYRLPYMWSDLAFEREADTVRYRGRRRVPPPPASYDIGIETGERYGEDELGALDHFLTARFILYTFYGRLAAAASAEHERWPLHRARVIRLEEDLFASAGLSEPRGEPLVHYSPGVDVRISRPYTARGR